jgi:hypothetical protein
MSSFQPEATVRFLIGQRSQDAVLTDVMPEGLRPPTLADAIAVQIATMREIGPIGGWKVGAANPEAVPTAAPLPASGVKPSPALATPRMRASECEIGFRFGKSLLPRDTPFTRDEVLAAIASCHATIEVVDPRFRSNEGLDELTKLADLGIHGSLAVGKAAERWSPDMFATLPVIMAVDGVKRRLAGQFRRCACRRRYRGQSGRDHGFLDRPDAQPAGRLYHRPVSGFSPG